MTEALGWIGSALIVLSLTQQRIHRLRWLNLAASAMLVVFNALIGVPSMVALNVVLVGVNLAALVRLHRDARPAHRRRSRREEVVDGAEKLGPRRLFRADEVARTIEHHQRAVGNERRELTGL